MAYSRQWKKCFDDVSFSKIFTTPSIAQDQPGKPDQDGAKEPDGEPREVATHEESNDSSPESLDSLHISDITSDVRLINCYNNYFGAAGGNLQQFYDLGAEGRLKVRNYGKTTEVEFQKSLNDWIRQSGKIPSESTAGANNIISPGLVLDSETPEQLMTQTV